MTLEELYISEKQRIAKLSSHYSRMFGAEAEELAQEGMLAVAETYARYGYKLHDEALLKVSHRIVNRRMYKYARDEYRHRIQSRKNTYCNG